MMFNILQLIQQATIAARSRTGDKTISTRVEAGRVQIVRVTFSNNGKSKVSAVSDWMSFADIAAALNAI